jgi:hypothetical protein
VPPGYQRQQPIKRPKLRPWLGVIDGDHFRYQVRGPPLRLFFRPCCYPATARKEHIIMETLIASSVH